MNSPAQSQFRPESRESWTPLLELAVREVFHLMLGCELTHPVDGMVSPTTITSMVGMAGQLCGVLSVRCDDRASVLVASKMLGVELSQVDDQVADAMGEICNMVAGNFKNKIAGMGDGCLLSPPTIISGEDYSMHALTDCPSIEVTLLLDGMPIIIRLQIHS